MPFEMLVGGRQLFVGHVDADDLARRSDKLSEKVGVAPGPRAEVEDAPAAQLGGHHEAAAVIF
jgi:hypothetical protein